MIRLQPSQILVLATGKPLATDPAMDAIVRERTNRLLRKKLGGDYHVNTADVLLVTPVPLHEVFDAAGKVIYRGKPYPKIVADRAYELYSEGRSVREISEQLAIAQRTVRKWHEQLDWDEKLSRQKALVDQRYTAAKVENALDVRATLDSKHKNLNDWMQKKLLTELKKEVTGKSAAEEKYLNVRSLKAGWECLRNMIEHERELAGIRDTRDQVVMPNNFTYEIKTPEGQVLASGGTTLADFLPNQDPHKYIPDKDQAAGQKELKHVTEIATKADDGTPETFNIHGKTKADPNPTDRHFYSGDVGFMPFS